jgi:hypothetical protein
MVRTLVAGLVAGVTMNLVTLLTFRAIGFGWNGDAVLLPSSIQSQKLIAVWTKLEPLPLMVLNLAPIMLGLLLFGIASPILQPSTALTC